MRLGRRLLDVEDRPIRDGPDLSVLRCLHAYQARMSRLGVGGDDHGPDGDVGLWVARPNRVSRCRNVRELADQLDLEQATRDAGVADVRVFDPPRSGDGGNTRKGRFLVCDLSLRDCKDLSDLAIAKSRSVARSLPGARPIQRDAPLALRRARYDDPNSLRDVCAIGQGDEGRRWLDVAGAGSSVRTQENLVCRIFVGFAPRLASH